MSKNVLLENANNLMRSGVKRVARRCSRNFEKHTLVALSIRFVLECFSGTGDDGEESDDDEEEVNTGGTSARPKRKPMQNSFSVRVGPTYSSDFVTPREPLLERSSREEQERAARERGEADAQRREQERRPVVVLRSTRRR